MRSPRGSPTWRTWSARLAAISSVSRSVTRTTRSCGAIRRQVRTAFRAPGASSSAYTDGNSVRFCIEIEPFLRRSGAVCPGFQVEAVARLVADVVHDLLQVSPRLVENAQLAVRSCAVLQDPVYALDLLAGDHLVQDVVHELEHLSCQVAEGHLDFLAPVD